MREDDIAPLDRDALERCMERAMCDPDMAAFLQSKLNHGGQTWFEVADFAAFHVQNKSLRLRPWEDPPSVYSEADADEGGTDGQRLLHKMLQAGLSRYEPDPRVALMKKKRAHEREDT
jgi:hypothetical protein